MLKENPKWIGKVVLVQLCVPTRSTVHEYKVLRKEVEELIGRINGNHAVFIRTCKRAMLTLPRNLDVDADSVPTYVA